MLRVLHYSLGSRVHRGGINVRPASHAFPAALIALAIAACGEPVRPPTVKEGAPGLSREKIDDAGEAITAAHVVLPSLTSDSDEVDWVPAATPTVFPESALHLVWLPASRIAHPRLFLFLPGANSPPSHYRLFSAEAARAGYHVIGLMYQNDRAVEAICKPSTDAECSARMRWEVLTGEDSSTLVTVSEGNSIDHRLERLLVYLKAQYPSEHWNKFLTEGKPDWSKITVGGHSQGAGQSALIARERLLPRVVMLSGPPEQRVAGVVDPWVRVGKTPSSSMFALYHFAEKLKPGISANLAKLDLDDLGIVAAGTAAPWCDLGTPLVPNYVTSADTRPASDWFFGDAHVLVTDLFPRGPDGCLGASNGNPHRGTARDAFTPLDGADIDHGNPKLLGAWRYLIGDPGVFTDDEENDEGEQ